ncbi:MAG TPA: HAD family hydrolase [Vicinamibacterales bacterium]|nr:HAD family hydrolase [Vicinamibacterales bacterium]
MPGRSIARAVFFDVDFTLIYPGPAFQGPGYRDFCARHEVAVDPARFEAAVAAASATLAVDGGAYDPRIFIEYTRRIIEQMGGSGPGIERAAEEIYAEWSACGHFHLYDEVPEVLRGLRAAGLKIGLISNTQRCLVSFQAHFSLEGLFDVAISSSAHGYMKPHPSIFEAALRQVEAAPGEALMVGDSLEHDIEGARRLGMRGVLVSRSGPRGGCPLDVPVIQSLRELPPLI